MQLGAASIEEAVVMEVLSVIIKLANFFVRGHVRMQIAKARADVRAFCCGGHQPDSETTAADPTNPTDATDAPEFKTSSASEQRRTAFTNLVRHATKRITHPLTSWRQLHRRLHVTALY